MGLTTPFDDIGRASFNPVIAKGSEDSGLFAGGLVSNLVKLSTARFNNLSDCSKLSTAATGSSCEYGVI